MVYGSLIMEQNEESNLISESEVLSFLGEANLFLELFDDNDELVTEGENIDTLRVFRAARKEYKHNIKAAKQALKSKDKEECKKLLDKAINNLKDAEKDIKSIKQDSVTSSILGWCFSSFLVLCYDTVKQFCIISVSGGETITGLSLAGIKLPKVAPVIGLTLTKGAQIINYVKNIINLINQIKKMIDNINNGDDTPQALNMWRNQLLIFIDDMIKNVEKVKKSI